MFISNSIESKFILDIAGFDCAGLCRELEFMADNQKAYKSFSNDGTIERWDFKDNSSIYINASENTCTVIEPNGNFREYNATGELIRKLK